tara:strand:+ start:232 stop:462 length:231 start_codon:yes stop_codon:yes gene_type:complete
MNFLFEDGIAKIFIDGFIDPFMVQPFSPSTGEAWLTELEASSWAELFMQQWLDSKAENDLAIAEALANRPAEEPSE